MRLRYLSLFVVLFFTSCLSYYQKNLDFQNKFESGQIEQAKAVLAKLKEKKLRKTMILYKMNQGVINAMLGDYRASNQFFEDAYIMGEDYHRNYANEAASFFFNPNVTVYKPEMHELLLIHYYKVINYLKLGQPDEALVECRRIDIKLAQFSDLYSSDKKLKTDAFAHNLMGIIYQSTGDYNNAFIAYRNAYNVYKNEYTQFFGVGVPAQLTKDLLYTAYRTGLNEEVAFYEKETGLKTEKEERRGTGDAILFWNDGLGPVKDQYSINFVLVRGSGGAFFFQNQELGISIPVAISESEYQSKGFGDLNVFRVAFPKFVERPLKFTSAHLAVGHTNLPLHLGMDVNQIAFKSLHDRMLTEMTKSLLRFATKKALEYQVRKQDQTVGALVGILGALTENADTRNWQTLPHSVFYTRASLPEGQHKANLKMEGNGASSSVDLTFDIQKGKTSFYNYYSLEHAY